MLPLSFLYLLLPLCAVVVVPVNSNPSPGRSRVSNNGKFRPKVDFSNLIKNHHNHSNGDTGDTGDEQPNQKNKRETETTSKQNLLADNREKMARKSVSNVVN